MIGPGLQKDPGCLKRSDVEGGTAPDWFYRLSLEERTEIRQAFESMAPGENRLHLRQRQQIRTGRHTRYIRNVLLRGVVV